MSDTDNHNSNQENADDIEQCCDGGGRCPSGPGGSGRGWKMIVFLLIIGAAGVILARSFISKAHSNSTQQKLIFAAIKADNNKSNTPVPTKIAEKAEAPVKSEIKTETPPAAAVTKQNVPVKSKSVSSLWKADLTSLASLNRAAANADAVFVMLSANDQLKARVITKKIESAARTIEADGTKVLAFRLKKSAPDYAQIAKQVSIPCVLAMVKGRGMSIVSGNISETKLVQAFVAASRPSSCGTSGCGAGSTSCRPAK